MPEEQHEDQDGGREQDVEPAEPLDSSRTRVPMVSRAEVGEIIAHRAITRRRPPTP
jgi:hypothetical protein